MGRKALKPFPILFHSPPYYYSLNHSLFLYCVPFLSHHFVHNGVLNFSLQSKSQLLHCALFLNHCLCNIKWHRIFSVIKTIVSVLFCWCLLFLTATMLPLKVNEFYTAVWIMFLITYVLICFQILLQNTHNCVCLIFHTCTKTIFNIQPLWHIQCI